MGWGAPQVYKGARVRVGTSIRKKYKNFRIGRGYKWVRVKDLTWRKRGVGRELRVK